MPSKLNSIPQESHLQKNKADNVELSFELEGHSECHFFATIYIKYKCVWNFVSKGQALSFECQSIFIMRFHDTV